MRSVFQPVIWCLFLLSIACAQAQNPGSSSPSGEDAAVNNTAIVLDASGSMWGQIDGIAKIAIARDVLNDMLDGWPAQQQLALTVYGHRREADCGDIEPIIALGKVDQKHFRSVLDGIKPKGKTPLTAAVQQAAAELAYREQPATVILLSDGLENCDLDPCQVAEELAAQGVNFTAHVIGFDVGNEDISGLRCLADHTGGTYATANNANTLSGALHQAVEKTRSETISLIAVLEAGGEPLSQGVSWQVQAPAADFNGKYTVLQRTGAPQGRVTLDNGTYRIVARRGDTSVAVLAEIDDSTQQVEVVLGAGDIRLQATLGEGTEPLTRGVNWQVFATQADFDGNYKRITSSGAPQAKFTLPAGTYRIQARRDATQVVKEISVVGGAQNLHVINLQAADIKASATLGADGPVLKRSLSWRVEAAEADFDGKYKRVAISGANEPTFTLPVGEYRLIARRGEAEQVMPLAIEAGMQRRVSVPLQAGEIIATAHLAEGLPALKRVNWQVQQPEADFDGKFPRVTVTGADQPRLTLASGRYRLLPTRGYASAVEIIEVTSGSQQRHQVNLNAGELNASAVDETDAAITRGLTWSVFKIATGQDADTASEQRLGVTGAPAPNLTLPAGDYRLVAKSRSGSAEQKLTVTPGQQQRIELQITP